MDKATENRIAAIETTVAEIDATIARLQLGLPRSFLSVRHVAEIDATIARLQQERENALLSDEEYASYVDQYSSVYDDEPLSIREYYLKVAELEQINSKFDKAKREEDFEALWDKYAKRLQELERVLAA